MSFGIGNTNTAAALPEMSHFGKAEGPHVEAKTSVWWDIANCLVPQGSDAHAIVQNIRSALAKMEYRGAVSISAYGDTDRLPGSLQQALAGTGVTLNHVPAGLKNALHKRILVDMLLWAVDNPAPANYLVISGNRGFSNILHQLHIRRYNILLAQTLLESTPLLSAAKKVWLWTNLSTGDPPLPIQNPNVKTTPETKQVNNTNSVKRAPHEFFPALTVNGGQKNEPSSDKSSYNKHIVPLWKIHCGSFSNAHRPPIVKPSPINHVEGLVGVILLALDTLRQEKVIPTESNIIDCTKCCYGSSKYDIIDLKKALDSSLQQNMVVKQNLGCLELFVSGKERLWSCINPVGGCAEDYKQATWDRVRSFLVSSSGRSAIYASNSRYEAAFILNRACLEELKLGNVLQILNIIGDDKRWIVHHPSGWQPITITLDEAGS